LLQSHLAPIFSLATALAITVAALATIIKDGGDGKSKEAGNGISKMLATALARTELTALARTVVMLWQWH